MTKSTALRAICILAATIAGIWAATSANPIEVGKVEWKRDFEGALAESARSGKPVFAFFQEVPGCHGCKTFGSEVMSHPLIVASVEDDFVPVLIYNNRPGKDAQLLARYEEPSWNYQVVRFLDGEGDDLIPRKDKVWTSHGIAQRMIRALNASGQNVPSYLQAVALEDDQDSHATVAFAQHCFWTGEFELGRIDGVVNTEAGWLDGREVTLVTYHKDQLSLEQLIRKAAKTRSADKVYLPSGSETNRAEALELMPVGRLDASYRRSKESDQRRQIRGTALLDLGLTDMQQTKVNALAPVDMNRALTWLTPEQRRRYVHAASKG